MVGGPSGNTLFGETSLWRELIAKVQQILIEVESNLHY